MTASGRRFRARQHAEGSCEGGGTGNTAGNPAFVDPDGPNNILGTDDDDLRIGAGSSAIDGGFNGLIPEDLFDLDRNPGAPGLDLGRGLRLVDDPAIQDGRYGAPVDMYLPTVDMGAYEYLNPGDDLGAPEPPPAGSAAPAPSGTAYIAFTYDALGRRIERTVDSGGASVEVTRYYYDAQNVVLETDADEAPRRSFVHGSQYIDERLLMRLPNGQEYYYLPRELYSVAALTDETGTIVEAATYDTYGQVAVCDGSAQRVDASPVGNPYYFTGRRLDLLPLAGGLKQAYHYRGREYGPGNGRFTQRDPLFIPDDEAARLHGSKLLPRSAQLPKRGIGTLAADANERNPYAYVASNPLRGVDPQGLQIHDYGFCKIITTPDDGMSTCYCSSCYDVCADNAGRHHRRCMDDALDDFDADVERLIGTYRWKMANCGTDETCKKWVKQWYKARVHLEGIDYAFEVGVCKSTYAAALLACITIAHSDEIEVPRGSPCPPGYSPKGGY